jgi:hypothetical protein
MRAEEYLNINCKPEDWNNIEECLKDSILTNNVIEHMERYAELRIKDVLDKSKDLFCPDCNSMNIQDTDYGKQCRDCFSFV